MISEELRDAESWRNYAKNSACITGINYILKYEKTEKCYLKL